MSNWNPDQISESFKTRAEMAELYLDEVREKAAKEPAYELILDQTLATFMVFNSLWGKTILNTRNELVIFLKGMLKNSFKSDIGYKNRERFLSFYKKEVENLLKKYG